MLALHVCYYIDGCLLMRKVMSSSKLFTLCPRPSFLYGWGPPEEGGELLQAGKLDHQGGGQPLGQPEEGGAGNCPQSANMKMSDVQRG